MHTWGAYPRYSNCNYLFHSFYDVTQVESHSPMDYFLAWIVIGIIIWQTIGLILRIVIQITINNIISVVFWIIIYGLRNSLYVNVTLLTNVFFVHITIMITELHFFVHITIVKYKIHYLNLIWWWPHDDDDMMMIIFRIYFEVVETI